MRHGKSDWYAGVEEDFYRPLNERGKKDSVFMGDWLKRQGLRPSKVVSSPALRAKRTAQAVCRAFEIDEKKILWRKGIYEAPAEDILQVLNELPVSDSVLLIGHNPGLEDVMRYLCGDAEVDCMEGKVLPTAAIALISLPRTRPLDKNCAILDGIFKPKALRVKS